MRTHYIIPVLFIILSLSWIYIAITYYGLWDEGPGGGFMPTIAASILLVFSVVSLLGVSRKENSVTHGLSDLFPVAVVIACVGLSQLIGLLPALFIALAAWLRFISAYTWTTSLSVAVCVLTGIWLIFSLWLNVPFPTGIL